MKQKFLFLLAAMMLLTLVPSLLVSCGTGGKDSTEAQTTTGTNTPIVTTTEKTDNTSSPVTTTDTTDVTTAPITTTGKTDVTTPTSTTGTPVTTPTPQEDGVDLVLFIGQSNMAGRGVTSDATKVEEGHAYEFRAISDPTKLYPLIEPFGVNENNASSGVTENKKTGSMVSAFCESYYQATGTPIVAVSCAKGGEKISFFDTSTKVYADAVARVKAAQDFLKAEYESGKTEYKLKNTYIVWLQGESDGDAGVSAATYTAALSRIVQGFKEDVGAAQTFIIPIGTYNGGDGARRAAYNTIRDAQILFSLDSADATVISTQLIDLHRYGFMKDEFHYTQEGYEIVGKDAGQNMAYFVTNGKKPDCQPYFKEEAATRENGAFLETDGKVVINASTALELSPFASYSTGGAKHAWAKSGASLDGIVQTPSSGTNWNITYAFFQAPQLHYTINFTNTGRYYLYFLTSYPDDAGNSLYVSIDSGDLIECISTSFGEGLWMSNAAWHIDIETEGEHTITVYAREDGVILNQIVLSTSASEALTQKKAETPSNRAPYTTSDMFVETDGRIEIELSCALENSKYAYTTTGRANNMSEIFLWERSAGYDGIQAYPDAGVQWATNNISPKASYVVDFSTPGEYYVMLYASFKDPAADSVYISVDGGKIVSCMNSIAVGNGQWLTGSTWKITIPYAGVHTINIFPREDGAVIHKLRLVHADKKDNLAVETLVLGDSYTNKTSWRNFDEQTAEIGASTVGISGSKVTEWLNYTGDLTLYNPQNIVIHIGVNDIDGGASGTTCGNHIILLLEKVKAMFPDAKIFYVSICDNEMYPGKWGEYAVSNNIVKAYIEESDGIYFVDFASVMKVEGATMANKGFRDTLHLNEEGYALFSKMICDAVKEANQA